MTCELAALLPHDIQNCASAAVSHAHVPCLALSNRGTVAYSGYARGSVTTNARIHLFNHSSLNCNA